MNNSPLNPEVAQLLAQFNDIILPEAVGWWPPSIALLTLVLLGFSVLFGVFWTLWTRHHQNQYRREADAFFAQALAKDANPTQKIIQANALVKQVAITHYGRKTVANLQGEDWVRFLKETAQYIDQPEALMSYLNAHYQQEFEYDAIQLDQILSYLKSWIKGHHK